MAVGLVAGATGKRVSAEPWSGPKTSFRATYQVRSTTDRLRRRRRGVTAAGRIGELCYLYAVPNAVTSQYNATGLPGEPEAPFIFSGDHTNKNS